MSLKDHLEIYARSLAEALNSEKSHLIASKATMEKREQRIKELEDELEEIRRFNSQ